jgi:hypothetical protein
MFALKEVSAKHDALKKEWRYCGSFVSFLSLLFSGFLTCVLHLTRPLEGEEVA